MDTEILFGLAGAPIVTALVQAFLQAVAIPKRFVPLLSVAFGVSWNIAVVATGLASANYGEAAIIGVLTGLAASGLYSGTKAVLGR